MSTSAKACADEILGLHQFFEEWFGGKLENSDAAFERCENALAADFRLINPEGKLTERGELMDRLRGAHGFAADTYLHIRIDNLEERPLGNGLHLVTYQEWQETDGLWTARWSTAVLREDPNGPHGMVWVHVQETWIANEEDEEEE